MQTVVETPQYLKAAEAIFSEAERQAIVTAVAMNPDCGDVIPGTGGFRKMRFGRSGTGKRGGARVIYIFRDDRFPAFLVTAYAKSEKRNLSQAEANQLRKRADDLFASYRSRRS
jgi:hypothetical protein